MTTSDEDIWQAIPSLPPDSSETNKLEELMELLRGLMSSVKIKNAMARQDPETAVITMAQVCLKFPLGLIQTIADQMLRDAEAEWPTAGQMISLLHAEADKGKPRAEPGPPPPTHKQTFVQALRSPQGQRALERGYGAAFAGHVCSGKVTILGADQDWYIKQRLAKLKERRDLTSQLKQGQFNDSLNETWRARLISLGEAMEQKNTDLMERYYQG